MTNLNLLQEIYKTLSKLLNSILKNKAIKKARQHFLIDQKIITERNEIVNKFNEFFVKIGNDLASSVPSTSAKDYLKGSYLNSFSLYLTDVNEVINIVSIMQNKYSSGYDSITVNIMKASIQVIADPLVYIINCSLSNGIFSDQLKIAKVCIQRWKKIIIVQLLTNIYLTKFF